MTEETTKAKDRVINFSNKKTEDQWAYSAQDFFETFTPLWFKWLGWIFATGGLTYLAKQTGSIGCYPYGFAYLLFSFILLFLLFRFNQIGTLSFLGKGVAFSMEKIFGTLTRVSLLSWPYDWDLLFSKSCH